MLLTIQPPNYHDIGTWMGDTVTCGAVSLCTIIGNHLELLKLCDLPGWATFPLRTLFQFHSRHLGKVHSLIEHEHNLLY